MNREKGHSIRKGQRHTQASRRRKRSEYVVEYRNNYKKEPEIRH